MVLSQEDLSGSRGGAAQPLNHSLTYVFWQEQAAKGKKTYESVRKGLKRAKKYGRKIARAAAAKRPEASVEKSLYAKLFKVVRGVGTPRDSVNYVAGVLLLMGLVFCSSAAVWSLPLCYLFFILCSLPHRIISFHRQKLSFFLIDFCYFVNALTVAYITVAPNNAYLRSMVYALADGPVSAAVIAWECAWVFGSADYAIRQVYEALRHAFCLGARAMWRERVETTEACWGMRGCDSVLMHIMPGLALYAERYFSAPVGVPAMKQAVSCAVAAWQAGGSAEVGQLARCIGHGREKPLKAAGWEPLLLAPMAFYCLWQLFYFLVVQMMCRGFIRHRGFDTSYNSLARKAGKTKGLLYRLVKKGSIMRRVCMFGLMQALFTAGTLLCFLPMTASFALATLWQVMKLLLPLYFGAVYQCERLPRYLLAKVVEQVELQTLLQQAAAAAGNGKPAAAAALAAEGAACGAAAPRADTLPVQSDDLAAPAGSRVVPAQAEAALGQGAVWVSELQAPVLGVEEQEEDGGEDGESGVAGDSGTDDGEDDGLSSPALMHPLPVSVRAGQGLPLR